MTSINKISCKVNTTVIGRKNIQRVQHFNIDQGKYETQNKNRINILS